MTEVIDTWQRFAEVTIKTNDLDPMYEVIYQLNKTKSRKWMGVFIMTFLLYYDAGQAVKVADMHEEDKDRPWSYWGWLQYNAQQNPTFMKRGTERRHFRGENERKALEKLASFGLEPWELLVDMYDPDLHYPTYTMFYQRMTTKFAGTQFGPYFIWKLYDIFNVCLDMPISLSVMEAMKYMPAEPQKAAEHFFPSFRTAVEEVTSYISQFDHPVVAGRKCGLAEAETVLCMMKGYFKTKTHEIGDDIDEKAEQLGEYRGIWPLLPDRVQPGTYKRGELK